jgi:Leucine-rich repeat (LRR) protein
MSGEFPPEVTYLKGSLVNMDLSDNPVFTRGENFNSWLGTLTNLEILRYENTNFINSGGVPTEIGNMKNLGFYECSNVRYLGAISSLAFPSDMTQLSFIEMEFNSFDGPIPTELGLLPNLQFFYARDSSLTGNLEFMRGMDEIKECWTDRNEGLTGALPTFFGTLSNLGSLSVTRSGWSGALPSELGLLVDSMRQMYFYNNAFTGQVPAEWGSLTNLQELQFQENDLTGQIPNSVCILKFTRALNLEADCDICVPTNCCSSCVN